MIFFKILVSVSIVMVLSLVAERVSPKVAGLLSGYPLGAAIALFFYGMEVSPEFAATSAVYTMIGLVATQSFVYFYFKASSWCRRAAILTSSAAAIGGYLLVAWGLHFLPVTTPWLAILIPVSSIGGFVYLFREIPNETIQQKTPLTIHVIILRAVLAASIIVLITGSARFMGPAWAGLFSAFPITLFPLILIVHVTYDTKHVHTIIKNFPIGLGSLIVYSLTVSVVYPSAGIYLGTLFSFAMATLYLLAYRMVITHNTRVCQAHRAR